MDGRNLSDNGVINNSKPSFCLSSSKISVKQKDRQNKQAFNDDGFSLAFSQIDWQGINTKLIRIDTCFKVS